MTKATESTICPRCKMDHQRRPELTVGDPVTSFKYGDGVIQSSGKNGRGCWSAAIKVASGERVTWSGEWRAKCDPLATDLRDRPTSNLLAIHIKLWLPGLKPLAWRAATMAERKAFSELVCAEIDARIPARRFDASDEPEHE